MPDEDDRFGDVAEQLKQTDEAEDDVEEGPNTPSEPVETADTDRPAEDAADDGPPFPFDETSMHGFYVREETWDRLTHTRSAVTAACSMFDVPEFEGREFQDACLRVVADHADEIALRILDERGVEADAERVEEVVGMLDEESE